MTYTLIVILPVLFVWLVVAVDIGVRRDLTGPARAGWLAAVTLVWPTMIAYLLLRPVQGRLITAAKVRRDQADPRQRLVEAVLQRQSGLIGDAEYARIVAELRAG